MVSNIAKLRARTVEEARKAIAQRNDLAVQLGSPNR